MKPAGEYAEIFQRVIDRVLLAHRPLAAAEVAALADRLERLDPAQRRLLATNSRLAGRPEVVKELIRRAVAAIQRSPSAALTAALVAVEVAEAMPAPAVCPALCEDLRAETLAYLANAWRLKEDFEVADATWLRSHQARLAGTGDPLLSAELLEIESALRTSWREFAAAERLLHDAQVWYGILDDQGRRGRSLFLLARVLRGRGELGESLRVASEALSSISGDQEAQLALLALLHIGYVLDEMGETHRALVLLHTAARRFHQAAPPLTLLSFRWTVGRLTSALGRPFEAREALEPVWRDFLGRQMYFDAALCALDLALVYARLHLPDLQRQLAEDMLPVFLRLGVEQEALAAFLLYVDAAKQHRATAQLIAKVLVDLEPLRRQGPPRGG